MAENRILLLVLAAAAYYDIREHRIPNWWVFSAMAAGAALCVMRAGEGAWTGFLLRVFLVFLPCFPLFLCRMIGAGDIKLTALICGYLGMRDGGFAVFLGFLIGAVWSLARMIADKNLFSRLLHLSVYIRQIFLTKEIRAYCCPQKEGYRGTVPLGACLFLGTAVFTVLRYQGLFLGR